MDSLRCSDLLHGRAQKVQLPNEVQSNSCCSHGFPDVWLSNSVFSEFFRLFESKSRSIGLTAKKSYIICIFYQGHVILWEKYNFRALFPLCHHLFSLCLHITLSHSRRSRSSCHNFITGQRFNRQSWNARFSKQSKRSFMPYNWFYQKRFLATKVGRYFHIKKKKKKKDRGGK